MSRRDHRRMLTVLALVAAVALGARTARAIGAGFPRPTFDPAPAASRAVGDPVLCSTSYAAWDYLRHAWHEPRGSLGVWSPPFILLKGSLCSDLRYWRRAWSDEVALAIYALGHEEGHAEQLRAGIPYNEHGADCYGLAHFGRIRRALGITRPLPLHLAGYAGADPRPALLQECRKP